MESDGVREGFLEEGLPPAEEATHAKSADRWVPHAGWPPTAVDIRSPFSVLPAVILGPAPGCAP